MKLKNILVSTTAEISKFLDSSPEDELYTIKELSEKFDVYESTIKSSRLLKDRFMVFDGKRYYGSYKAITALLNATK